MHARFTDSCLPTKYEKYRITAHLTILGPDRHRYIGLLLEIGLSRAPMPAVPASGLGLTL